MKWLQHSNKLGLPVPKFYTSNRHIISQELIDGIDLVKLSKIPNPIETMEKILDFIENAWQKGRFVHGDLSEYNVIMTHDAEPIIIDFPQSISRDAKGAVELLERDINNILTYFERKHGLNLDFHDVLSTVKGNIQ